MVGLLTLGDFFFLPPICLAIAIVTSAAHREEMPKIFRHAVKSWVVYVGGMVLFLFLQTWFFNWVLPS